MENNVNSSELKRIELGIFKEYIKICEKFNLTYFIAGGTALGAVRHGGFIPWDDDIDVVMPRPDYDKFLQYAQKELPNELFLQTNDSDKDYVGIYAKLRNSNTTFIETSVKNLSINHGVFIDIFPIDGYPSDYKKAKKIKQKSNLVKKALNSYYYPSSFRKRLTSIISKIILGKFTKKSIITYFDNYAKKIKYEESLLTTCHGGVWGDKEIVKKEYYGQGKLIKFENLFVNGPEKIEDYLKSKYGDYMQLPPIEKRVSHHYCETIDLQNSYKKY